MSASMTAERPSAWRRFDAWVRNPWAQARFLWVGAIAYVVWTIVPVVIAVMFSFNAGKAQTTWQGFSINRWYTQDVSSVFQDPELRSALAQSFKLSILVVLIAVPLGVAFAIALDRWRGRGAGSANFVMLFSFITPEIAIGVGLFLLVTQLVTSVGLGFKSQVLGLSMYELAYPVIIVRARLLSIGGHYEEAAMDLGASPDPRDAARAPPLARARDPRERRDRVRLRDRQLRDLAAALRIGLVSDDPDRDLQLGPALPAPLPERARDPHALHVDGAGGNRGDRLPEIHPQRTRDA